MKNLTKHSYILILTVLYSGINTTIFAQKTSLMNDYSWRAIGPANMGGRVTDIDGVPGDASTFYVSGADGGIHKTTDGGSVLHLFLKTKEPYSIGALTLAPSDKNVLGGNR